MMARRSWFSHTAGVVRATRSAWFLLAVAGAAGSALQAAAPLVYSGMCDASAAIALDDRSFLIADDEQSVLRVYAADRPGSALQRIPFTMPWGVAADADADGSTELDIEGVAQIKDRIYWITSHGRNKNGVLRPYRHQFFAVQVSKSGQGFVVSPVGTPVHNLASSMAFDPKLQHLGLNAVLRLDKKKVKELAPKAFGLNIEGLSETRDGTALLIGLRNPQPHGKALIVTLRNPEAVVMNQALPDFGPPILLDLAVVSAGKTRPLGIRSIAYIPQRDRYLIAAGSHDAERVFALFQWSGQAEDPPQLLRSATDAIAQLGDFAPEAIVVYAPDGRIQLCSDDGALEVPVASPAECRPGAFRAGRCEAKELLDEQRKTFRSVFVTME